MNIRYRADAIFDGNNMWKDKLLVADSSGYIICLEDDDGRRQDVESLPGILCPGFINCHCHLELSHFKGLIPEHTGLVEFVQHIMRLRMQGLPSPEEHVIDKAYDEMLKNGTVAVGDICNTTDSLEIKSRRKDIRWKNFIEVSGFIDATAEKRLNTLRIVQDAFTNADQEAVLVPHAPYSVSKTLFSLLNEETKGKTISIHNQETPAEDELYIDGKGGFLGLYRNFGIDISGFKPTGKSSFKSWRPYFDRGQQVISVHNTFINQEDLELSADTWFCLCPGANLYIENTLPPVEMLMNKTDNIVLGTDSLASNHQLSIAAEMKLLKAHFGSISLETLLRWATLNGAIALGIEDRYGSFEPGKKPGLVLFDPEDFSSSLLLV